MATHSSILAWRIPWTEEPGGLSSMGSQRVKHDWACSHAPCHRDDGKSSEEFYLQKNLRQVATLWGASKEPQCGYSEKGNKFWKLKIIVPTQALWLSQLQLYLSKCPFHPCKMRKKKIHIYIYIYISPSYMVCVQWKPAWLLLLSLSIYQLNKIHITIICLLQLYFQTSVNECFSATMVQKKIIQEETDMCHSHFGFLKTLKHGLKKKKDS